MWVYRLGLAKAKYCALTGEWLSGKEAADIELINFSYPLEELDARITALAAKLAKIPVTQLATMKLIVNQAYDNMGLQSTQTLGPILDGVMRNTPEGRSRRARSRASSRAAMKARRAVRAALMRARIARRDAVRFAA
jgi:enoyl-CoA hydratase